MLCMRADTYVQLAAMRLTPSRVMLATVSKQRGLLSLQLPPRRAPSQRLQGCVRREGGRRSGARRDPPDPAS